ncbi:uncharacterized protein LOC124656121 [Lolium rigidum]|uniref:uncharacterized protein LOC124656121 n=1 Tax=Lolium rigidum TaxID=89674 RepID=UPI001F5D8B45|nr:uncharacterized protein LOC124656121 [Lolium rigidum]
MVMDSLTPAPAAEASLAPAPAAEASSYPPPADEEWMKEEREKGRALKLYLSQLDPDECLRSVQSTLVEMAKHSQMDTKSAKQAVEKRWMDTVTENLIPTTTDPDILKARYLFERLVEKRETIENGMKWMRKEVLQAFESYRSLAAYNKVCLMFTLKFHSTFFFSYGCLLFSKS